MSLREINELVNERAKKYFVHPQLMINLAKQRPTQVYLLGDVLKPGLYCPDGGGKDDVDISTGGGGGELSGSSTEGGGAAKLPATGTIFTLSSALQLAGGLKESADIRHIHVTRQHPKQVLDVDLWKLMLDGDVTEDLVLQPGDVVFVPKGGTEFNTSDFGKVVAGGSKVRIIGAVKSPGLYMMSADDDLVSVLAKAGGFTNTAKTKSISVSRVNRDGTTSTEKINVKGAMKGAVATGRLRVHPGEVIVVDNSMAKTIGYGAARIMPQMLMSGVMSILMFRLNNTTTTTTTR
jgi:polysaccharide export outer membrane protein